MSVNLNDRSAWAIARMQLPNDAMRVYRFDKKRGDEGSTGRVSDPVFSFIPPDCYICDSFNGEVTIIGDGNGDTDATFFVWKGDLKEFFDTWSTLPPEVFQSWPPPRMNL